MDKKKIGIIGGMGPLATAELFRLIVELTDSKTDSGHIRIFIDNNTSIPDRSEAILTGGTSPVSEIVHSARLLQSMGSDFLLLPCNTSHFFFHEIQQQIDIEILNMVSETVNAISKKGVRSCGVLATTGAICGGVYQKALNEAGIRNIQLSKDEQQTVMQFIYSGVKANEKQYDVSAFQRVVQRLYADGAELLIMGCTEIKLGVEQYNVQIGPVIEPMEVLASRAIIKAGYPLKEK